MATTISPPPRPVYSGNAFSSLENDGSEIRKIFERFAIFPVVMIFVNSPYVLIAFTNQPGIFAPTVSPFLIFLFYVVLAFVSLSSIFLTFGAILLSSFLFGILIRLEFNTRAPQTWIKSVLYFSSTMAFIFLIHLLPLYLSLIPIALIFFILFSLLQNVIFIILFIGIMFLPGLVSASLPFENLFGTRKNRTEANTVMYRNFLFLTPEMVPYGEPFQYCPFKDKRKNTCSYLNYPTSGGPLICDFQSTFTRCLAYGRLVQKLQMVIE
ncbi:MAG: hypothetical protein D6732_21350 [Methanobacteriota archaeon]|nr:MAG: hypothetical protein D6732_21350 [Euryarchaeota archaeon]